MLLVTFVKLNSTYFHIQYQTSEIQPNVTHPTFSPLHAVHGLYTFVLVILMHDYTENEDSWILILAKYLMEYVSIIFYHISLSYAIVLLLMPQGKYKNITNCWHIFSVCMYTVHNTCMSMGATACSYVIIRCLRTSGELMETLGTKPNMDPTLISRYQIHRARGFTTQTSPNIQSYTHLLGVTRSGGQQMCG